MGHMTRELELRYTPKGTAVGQFGLAINRKWRTEAGEDKEEVTFVDCQVWAASAETLSQYTKKGDPLMIEGRLAQELWDDKQTGQKRSRIKIVVESFQFLNRAPAKGQSDSPRQPAAAGRSAPPVDEGGHGQAADDDDVPF